MNRRKFVRQVVQTVAGVALAPVLPLAKILAPVRALYAHPALGAEFNIQGTVTGRMSSKYPNYSNGPQDWPKPGVWIVHCNRPPEFIECASDGYGGFNVTRRKA